MDINKHERRIEFNGNKVSFLKESYHVWLLDKVQKGIEEIKDGAKNATLELELNELTTIRRLLVLDDISTELCRENLLEGLALSLSRRKDTEVE